MFLCVFYIIHWCPSKFFLIIFSFVRYQTINIGADNKEIPATRAACKILTREHHGRVLLSWASKTNVWLIVFLNFYLLCFCNSSPDLQFLICMGSHQHCIKNTRPDQSCCECCSCGWIHFFVACLIKLGILW